MSDTDSNSDYPPFGQNLFDSHSFPVGYPEIYKPSTTPLPSLPPSPHPMTPVKMAPGSSSKDPQFPFSTRGDKKTAVNVQLHRFGKLT